MQQQLQGFAKLVKLVQHQLASAKGGMMHGSFKRCAVKGGPVDAKAPRGEARIIARLWDQPV